MSSTLFGQLWKLLWNRRRANALILAELTAAFLVLAGLATAAAYYWHNYRQPLGYALDDTWVVNVGHGYSDIGTGRILDEQGQEPEQLRAVRETERRLIEVVRALPGVLGASATFTGPYLPGMRSTTKMSSDDGSVPPRGHHLLVEIDHVDDQFAAVLGLRLLRGRFFGREDDGAAYLPIVINERMARDFFADEDPLGRQIGAGDNNVPQRVVGVVAGYRQGGELAPPQRYMFHRYRIDQAGEFPYHRLLVKARPGSGPAFETALEKALRATAGPDWTFTVHRLEDVRAVLREGELRPLVGAAIIGAFLMLMVVLGLTGVLWQNVTQRTREIGLRRAKGATRWHIHGQILGELLVMTVAAVSLGGALVAHAPFLGLVEDVTAGTYLLGAGGAAALLLLLATLCGVYPARLAARVQPAEALRTD